MKEFLKVRVDQMSVGQSLVYTGILTAVTAAPLVGLFVWLKKKEKEEER